MSNRSIIVRATTLSGISAAIVGLSLAATSAKTTQSAVRPNPQATTISASSTGPLLRVYNTTTAGSASGIQGYVTNSNGGVGMIGYGVSKTLKQYGIFGSVFGPGGVGIHGTSYFPEPAGGPTAATETIGAYGTSYNGDGVVGATGVQQSPIVGGYAGVYGADATSNSGYNDGVLGLTTNGFFGVEGVGGSGSIGGAAGIADNGSYGVYGQSASNTGVIGNGGNEGVAGMSGGYPFVGMDGGGNVVFTVDSTGTVMAAGAMQQIAVARGNSVARAFVPSATTPLLEDTGTATLVRGAGTVRLDPAFASSISNAVYQVFLTPDGESNGLYVSRKSASEFVVRENNSGRASIDFDYRIVAKPYASTGKRIAIARTAAELGMPLLRTANAGTAKVAKLLNAASLHRSTEAILRNASMKRMPAAPRFVGTPQSR